MPTKVCILVFPLVMYRYESWTVKKAECQKIDAFELWCWRRLLKVPLKARRSNQSILKEINTEYSLEGLMLKLKLQFFGHPVWRADSLEKTLIVGKTKGKRRREQQRMKWTEWTHSVQFSSVQSLSCVRVFGTPWTAAYQAPLSMGVSRQEYWSGSPVPSPII